MRTAAPKKPGAGPGAEPAKTDAPYPPAFCDFMLTRWAAPSGKLPAKVPGLSYFVARRQALSAQFPGEILVVPTGAEKVRANDTTYPFRPGSDFYYLTGNLEPDCVLVMVPRPDDAGHDSLLFVEPNPGRTETTFFTDRVKGELWVGPRLGIAESLHRFGVDACVPLAELAAHLGAVARGRASWRLLRQADPRIDAALAGAAAGDGEEGRHRGLAEALAAMRLIKDAHELRALERACDSTRRGFEDVIARLKIAVSEREVEGVFNLRARMEGNAVGYNTIAASGQHACVLHWSQNLGALRHDELLLLDAGVEGHELYTADVTRTLPISGTFSGAQRRVYELVLRAQEAAFAEVRPGNDFLAPHHAAMRVLAHGLVELGVLADAAAALQPDQQFFKRYTLHGVSHMLGLDVHDCAQARQEVYRWGPLRPGMVLTVEPGLYFQADDLTVPRALRGIGVRIEDDLVVTRTGFRILSELPREADAVERWMRTVWQRRD